MYPDGNPTDKALIAHNAISLHCKYDSLIVDIDDKVFDSIKTNYKLYLRNNVGHYLDLKRDISKFIQNAVAHVGDHAVSILNKFKTNLLAILGFLFTIISARVGAAQKWDDIFTRHTVYHIGAVLLGFLRYLVKRGMVGWSIMWDVLLIAVIIIIEVYTENKGLLVWLWNKISCNV